MNSVRYTQNYLTITEKGTTKLYDIISGKINEKCFKVNFLDKKKDKIYSSEVRISQISNNNNSYTIGFTADIFLKENNDIYGIQLLLKKNILLDFVNIKHKKLIEEIREKKFQYSEDLNTYLQEKIGKIEDELKSESYLRSSSEFIPFADTTLPDESAIKSENNITLRIQLTVSGFFS